MERIDIEVHDVKPVPTTDIDRGFVNLSPTNMSNSMN